MALQGRTKLEELEIQMGSDMRGSQTVLNQFVCMSVVPEIPNLRVLEMGNNQISKIKIFLLFYCLFFNFYCIF